MLLPCSVVTYSATEMSRVLGNPSRPSQNPTRLSQLVRLLSRLNF